MLVCQSLASKALTVRELFQCILYFAHFLVNRICGTYCAVEMKQLKNQRGVENSGGNMETPFRIKTYSSKTGTVYTVWLFNLVHVLCMYS